MDRTTYDVEATFSGSPNTATLMRFLTVLNIRADEVLALSFDGTRTAGAQLSGRVTLGRATPEALEAWLQRPVNVVDARVRLNQ
jgi:hypothetical protein